MYCRCRHQILCASIRTLTESAGENSDLAKPGGEVHLASAHSFLAVPRKEGLGPEPFGSLAFKQAPLDESDQIPAKAPRVELLQLLINLATL